MLNHTLLVKMVGLYLHATATVGGMLVMEQCLMETLASHGPQVILVQLLVQHALEVSMKYHNIKVMSFMEMMPPKNIDVPKAIFWPVAHAILGGNNVMEPSLMETPAESTTDGVTITQHCKPTVSESEDG